MGYIAEIAAQNGLTETEYSNVCLLKTYYDLRDITERLQRVVVQYNTTVDAVAKQIGIMPQTAYILWQNGPTVNQDGSIASYNYVGAQTLAIEAFGRDIDWLIRVSTLKNTIDNKASKAAYKKTDEYGNTVVDYAKIASEESRTAAYVEALYLTDRTSTATDILATYMVGRGGTAAQIQAEKREIETLYDQALSNIESSNDGGKTIVSTAMTDLINKLDGTYDSNGNLVPGTMTVAQFTNNLLNPTLDAITTEIKTNTLAGLASGKTFAQMASTLQRTERYLIGLVFRDDILGNTGTVGIFTERNRFTNRIRVTRPMFGGKEFPLAIKQANGTYTTITKAPIYMTLDTDPTVQGNTCEIRGYVDFNTWLTYRNQCRKGMYAVTVPNYYGEGVDMNGYIQAMYVTIDDQIEQAYRRRITNTMIDVSPQKMPTSQLEVAVQGCCEIHNALYIQARINYYDRNNYTDAQIAEELGFLDEIASNDPDRQEKLQNAYELVRIFRRYTF